MNDRFTRLFCGLFLVALGTLLYEIALIRVLSFTIWYHFAYTVISTALLGFGASGSLLAVRPSIGSVDLPRSLGRACLLAAITGAAFLGAMSLFPFDPMKIVESRRDLVIMLGYEIGATIPFFFSGLAVSLALRTGAARVDRLYFWDLAGAALGCAISVALMNALTPPGAVLFACAILAAAAMAFSGRSLAATSLAGALLASALFAERIPLTPAASKSLSVHIEVQKMVPVFSKWTSLFRTDVVEKREAGPPSSNLGEWGLSGQVPYRAQPAWGFLTHDGSAGAPIYDLRKGDLAFLDDHILRLPYLAAGPHPRVLVIGVGGGRDVLTALRYEASHVTGIELDPVTVGLLKKNYAEQAQGAFTRSNVDLVAGEGRHFVERSKEHYDVIQITGVDTLAAQTSGAYVLAENYLYTTDAFQAYLDHLTPHGSLSIGSGDWNPNEPQGVGRMLLVARQALQSRGIANPERHIVAVASLHLITEILVRTEPFPADELDRIERDAKRLGFLPLVLGGREAHPLYGQLMQLEGPDRQALLDSLPYVIDPVTDESPFFFRFFRWSDLPKQTNFGPAHTSALGQLVLVVLFVSLSALGLLLIVGPMLAFRRRGLSVGRPAAGVLTYFVALGMGFMLLEISLMQRFALYLGYPTYSLTVVLLSLLLSLGTGSYLSRRWVGHERRALPTALLIVTGLIAFYRFGLPWVEHTTLGAPFAARVALTAVMLAPLGLVLGIFFPLGIRRAESIHPDLVPWAWGINGCASVIASILAVLLAMAFGFGIVWLIALATYVAGVAALLSFTEPSGTSDASAAATLG